MWDSCTRNFGTKIRKKAKIFCNFQKSIYLCTRLTAIRIDSLAQQVEHNTFNVGVLGSSPKRITQTKSKTMKTADNQSLSAVFLFIHTANWSRIPHLTGGEIGGLNFHIKTSPPDWIIFHWFSAFCIKQTLFKTCIFTPSKKRRVWQCKETILRYCFSWRNQSCLKMEKHQSVCVSQ